MNKPSEIVENKIRRLASSKNKTCRLDQQATEKHKAFFGPRKEKTKCLIYYIYLAYVIEFQKVIS